MPTTLTCCASPFPLLPFLTAPVDRNQYLLVDMHIEFSSGGSDAGKLAVPPYIWSQLYVNLYLKECSVVL